MPYSPSPPITRATGLGALPALLEERGGMRALCRVFDAEGAPLEIIENRQTFIPLASMMGLFERAGRELGDRTFGTTVGMTMSPGSFGLWLEYCAAAPTLGAGLSGRPFADASSSRAAF